jgi:hypothetical protein
MPIALELNSLFYVRIMETLTVIGDKVSSTVLRGGTSGDTQTLPASRKHGFGERRLS